MDHRNRHHNADRIAEMTSSNRPRWAARLVTRASACVALVAMLALVAGCGSDDDSGVVVGRASDSESTAVTQSTDGASSTAPSTVAPATTPDTTPAETAAPTTTAPPTTAAPTTAAPIMTGWVDATEDYPPLAYIACCGSDWVGDPSPPIPADPAAPLLPGIYNAQPAVEGQPANGVLTLDIRPYTRCSDLVNACFEEGPYEDTDLGVPSEPGRAINLALDDSVRAAVSGFGCDETGQLLDIRQIGAGTDAQTLFDELDASYEAVVGSQLRAGVPPEQIADDITANSPSGFYATDCPTYSQFGWTPSEGPPIIALLSLTSFEGVPPPEPLASAAASWIRPTAIEVDDDGTITVYLYANFLS